MEIKILDEKEFTAIRSGLLGLDQTYQRAINSVPDSKTFMSEWEAYRVFLSELIRTLAAHPRPTIIFEIPNEESSTQEEACGQASVGPPS